MDRELQWSNNLLGTVAKLRKIVYIQNYYEKENLNIIIYIRKRLICNWQLFTGFIHPILELLV